MTWQTICDPVFSGRLCMTLVHSLWQVALFAAMAWGLDRLWRRRSVESSYVVYVLALIAGLAAMPLTYALVAIDTWGAVRGEFAAGAASPTALPAVRNRESPRPLVSPGEQTPNARDLSIAPDTVALAPVTAAAEGPLLLWSRVTPWVVSLYVVGVLLMLVRLIRGMWQAYRLGARAQAIGDGPLANVLKSLSQKWSMRIVPALAKAEEIVVPKVVGLLRPTILLPVSAINGLSTDEMEMILAHELAHVRRYDMWVNLVQRVSEVVLFFNPALWYLSRRISTLREYCCDELTCRATSGSDAELRTRYASALLRIVELSRQGAARRVQTFESGELAALAAGGRSPSELRRRVARLFGEPLHEPVRFSRGGLLMLAVLAGVLLTAPTAWQSAANLAAAPTKDAIKNDAGTSGIDMPQQFDLLVVGPDGKPIPRAAVEIRTERKPTAKEIQRGQFVKNGPYGTFFTTDAGGRLVIRLPKMPKGFAANINQAGFGPYWAEWDSQFHPEPLAARFTAELEAAWTVGGVVVDSVGAPIKAAKVRPRIKYKKRPGDFKELWIGTELTTDASGRWSFASVPASMREVNVSIDHPDYKPHRLPLTRSEFGILPGHEPKARITLKRGLEMTGSVRDESGKPIAGALLRTKFFNEIRQATTGRDGTYRLVGCEPGMAKIVVWATGKAMDFRDVLIEPEMKPVDFTMKPGGKIRIRVLDDQGKPVAKFRVFFQWWRRSINYFEFDNIDQYADGKGLWQWNEAPLDEIRADICPRGGGMELLEQPLIAREKEYVFRVPPSLIISGDVTEAATGKPIKRFRVVPGIRSGKPNASRLDWVRGDSFTVSEGHYELRPDRAHEAHLVRIEADGREVAVSRDIRSDEGIVRIDFQLKPAGDIAATILTPAGKPAAEAKVALGIVGSQIQVKNGHIDDGGTSATRRDADESGRFRFPSPGTEFQLVITHPSGFAYLKSSGGPIPSIIHLTPWARVEGTFRAGQQTVPSVGITLNANAFDSYGRDVPHIMAFYDTTTGPDGRFVFERVYPGEGRIGRRLWLTVKDGATEATSSKMVAARFVAGETVKLDFGGTGRRVTGRLAPPAQFQGSVLWNFALVDVRVWLPHPKTPPADVQRGVWWKQWMASDEGKAWQAAYKAAMKLYKDSPHFTATVNRDGSFHVDDMPPGAYELNVRFSEHPAGYLTHYRFSVPETSSAEPGRPIDLGVLTLTHRQD